MSRKIFHIFMAGVDYLSQLASIHHLLEHPHFYFIVKIWILSSIGTHYFGDGRAPAQSTLTG